MVDFYKKVLSGFHSLHIDLETYSSIDLLTAGVYKYVESPDFEILLLAYAFDDEKAKIVDIAAGEKIPEIVERALTCPTIKKHAHNAAFERLCLRQYGYDIPVEQWFCTMVKAAYCGLPLSLDKGAKALKLDPDKQKDAAGKALIKFFCVPCKPTKANGFRVRNFHHHDPTKWQAFKGYCLKDVVVEREIDYCLELHELPEQVQKEYWLDQAINDRGVLTDTVFAQAAIHVNDLNSNNLTEELEDLTGVENVNSPAQLKHWLSVALGQQINSLAKDELTDLIAEVEAGHVKTVLQLRQKLSKTSIKKYFAMLTCACADSRSRGLFQFYGANRTGRWAGRLIQLQNLPRNFLKVLAEARAFVRAKDYEALTLVFDDISNVLSQLIRTAFIAPPKKLLAVADFSAIEARVIAWLANETWRLEVFSTHGKIYEASAAAMFGMDIEDVDKETRAKGKVAELALGYQGSVGALLKMGAEAMGLKESELKPIVKMWRKANPAIVALWYEVERCAVRAVETKKAVVSKNRGLVFEATAEVFTIELPSGRKLYYQQPFLKPAMHGKKSLAYYGLNDKKVWGIVDTYGGKLVENIVQAIARDILAHSLNEFERLGLFTVMHVHDEAVVEAFTWDAEETLKTMLNVMRKEVKWAKGLPLGAEGYLTPFYKKD